MSCQLISNHAEQPGTVLIWLFMQGGQLVRMHPHFMNAEPGPAARAARDWPIARPIRGRSLGLYLMLPTPCSVLSAPLHVCVAMEIVWKATTPTEAGMLGAKSN